MLKSGRALLRSALLAALLTTFLITSASAATLSTLGPGSRGEAVVTLKNELTEKGYYTVKSDNTDLYTSTLKSAVVVFQKANSIKPAKYGYADEQTQIKAASDDAVFYAEYIEKQMDAQLQPGGAGTYVKNAQKQLTKLGYYTGKIDGKYRSSTKAAVAYFQTANTLPVTGNADSQTRSVLYSTADVAPVTRAQYEAANNLTPLSYGSKGDQVTQLQTRLAANGFYWCDPTGVYDLQTKYSVRFFQEANGFTVNGNANTTLRAKLNGDTSVTFAEYTKNMTLLQLSSGSKPGIRVAVLQHRLQELGYYKSVVTGVYSGSTITAVRTFQIFNNMSSKYVTGKANTETRKLMLTETAKTYADVCGDDTLKLGDSGDAVKKLQTRLKELGYYQGELDGIYSGAVATAVKLFQRYNDFYPSGVAYTNVQVTLYSTSAVSYTNAKIEKLIAVAESKYGCEYTLGKRGPYEFDCSGFTYYCLKQVGVNVTSEVERQGSQVRSMGKKIITDYRDLRRGDMLYFWSPDHKKKPGHAGIFMGIKGTQYRFIHASSSYDKVTISNMKTDYYLGDDGAFLFGVRLWE